MKITSTTGPPRGAGVDQTRAAHGRADAAGRGGATFAPTVAGGRPAAAPVGATPSAPLTSLAALLAVQEVPGAGGEERRRRAAGRGGELLDRLDELRLALLENRLPEAALRRLAALLEARVEPVDDPALAAVLEEIELRAAVELAKLERG